MANNSSNPAQCEDVDDAYGEPTLRAYHDGPNWYENGVNEIDAFFPESRNSPPTTTVPSATIVVPDRVSKDVPASVERPSRVPRANDSIAPLQDVPTPVARILPPPRANDFIAILHEVHGSSSEVASGVRPEQAAPSSAQHRGNVANIPSYTSQNSILPLTSGSGNEQGPFSLSLFASLDNRNTVSSSFPEHEEIYRGPDANTGTKNSYMGASTSDTNVPSITSPYPADAQDEDEVPSRTSKRKGSDASSTSDQPVKKQAKVSAGNAENGSDVEMLDQEDSDDEDLVQEESNGGDLGQEDSDEGGSEEEESDDGNLEHEDSDEESDSSAPTFSPITPPMYASTAPTAPPRGRGRGRGRSRGKGRGRGVAATGNAATQVNAITLSLFTNNTLPPNYPFNHVSAATIEGNWPRYGFVSLAAARIWIRGRP